MSRTVDTPDVRGVLRLLRPAVPLPQPTGQVRRACTAHELLTAAQSAAPNTTILLADGTYRLPMDKLQITADGVCLRGESGNRDRVVLDGDTQWGALLSIHGASDVMLADFTVRDCRRYGVLVYGDSGAHRLRVHGLTFHNCWVRGLKGTHPRRIGDRADELHAPAVADRMRPSGGSVRHCLFLADHPKVFTDDTFDGDYISGIDMMGLHDWTFADNAFIGIRGKNRGGRGALFVWVGSDHVVAERNIIVNCDRGICFGNPSGDGPHMTAGVVRSNVIVGGANMAIEMAQTVDTPVVHNTVFATNFPYRRTLNFAHGCAGGRCLNNLVHGRMDQEAAVEASGNTVGRLDGWFADPSVGDLRLTPLGRAMAGVVPAIAEAPGDFEGRTRASLCTPGAYEAAEGPSSGAP